MRWIAITMVLMTTGCDPKANPRSCLDGVCSDPDVPFCDIDGTFGGAPKECIDVGCTVGMFERCVGADAYTCNEFGNNFHVETCAAGCDDAVGGCRVCSTNSDCEAATPVCDVAMNSCRQCTVDTECDSKICDVGRCLDESSTLYVAASGSGSANCTQNAPCSLTTALSIAINDPAKRTIWLGAGTYPSLELTTPTSTPIHFVGQDDAIVDAFDGAIIGMGASASLRNLTLTGTNRVLTCGQTGGVKTSLVLNDLRILRTSDADLVHATNCDLQAYTTEFRSDSIGDAKLVLAAETDATVSADRIQVRGLRTSSIYITGMRSSVTVTNSILENVQLVNLASQSNDSVVFDFNTFVQRNSDTTIECSLSGAGHYMRFRKNIIFSTVLGNVINAVTSCDVSGNILSSQSPVPMFNVVADPQFVSVSTGDFRVNSSSPAVGGAGMGPYANDHDVTGAPRPQGGAYDIGAYEQ